MATTRDITYFDTPAVFKFWARVKFPDGSRKHSPVYDTYEEARSWAKGFRIEGDRTKADIEQRRIN